MEKSVYERNSYGSMVSVVPGQVLEDTVDGGNRPTGNHVWPEEVHTFSVVLNQEPFEEPAMIESELHI